MHAEALPKITLEAVATDEGIRFDKGRVALSEPATYSDASDVPGQSNPAPLLAFLAHYKLHTLLKKQGRFKASSNEYPWVRQLWDLIKNCGKKQHCWVDTVFGKSKSPNRCNIHKVIKVSGQRSQTASLAPNAPAPDEIELILDGGPLVSEDQLRGFLSQLGALKKTGPQPAGGEGRTASTAPTGADGSAQGERRAAGSGGTLSVPFVSCAHVQEDLAAECLRRLDANHRLQIRWLGMGMQYGCLHLESLLKKLARSSGAYNISVFVAMLAPRWPDLDKLRAGWKTGVGERYERLRALRNEYRRQASGSKRRVAIEIGTYKYVTNWLGMVVDDEVFYLTLCSWKERVPGGGQRELVGWENPCILVRDDGRGGIESQVARGFLSWFEYAFNSSRHAPAKRAVKGKPGKEP